MVRGAVADRHDHHHRVMIVTSLSVAREREQARSISCWFAAGHLANFRRQSGPGADCRHAAGEHRAGYWHLGLSNPVRRFAAAVLLYDGHLRSVAGGIWSADFVAVLNPAAGFIGVFVFMMPAILLSGYVSPVENMPQWLQDVTWINPIRHFTDITKQIYLKDASLEIVGEVCGRYWS
jgi:ABC-2 type transport system permease protein